MLVFKTLLEMTTTILIFTFIISLVLYKYNKTYRKVINELKKELSSNPDKVKKITHIKNTLYNYFFVD